MTQTRARRTSAGALAVLALLVGSVSGNWWSGALSSPQAAGCTTFSKYGGTVPCNGNVHISGDTSRVIGTTLTGCALGALGGTPISVAGGCLGGAASGIRWDEAFAE